MSKSNFPLLYWRDDARIPCYEYQLQWPEVEKRNGYSLDIGMIGGGKVEAYARGDVTFLERQGHHDTLFGLTQCHGSDVYTLQKTPGATGAGLHSLGTADALVIPCELLVDTPVSIKTADCAPIVVIGSQRCALIHAGWRGLASSIIQKTLDTVDCLAACVFPAARSCCYEIGHDVEEAIGENAVVEYRDDRCFLDVSHTAYQQLIRLIPASHVYVSPVCTICDSRLHSYRREGTSCGHNYTYLRAVITE